MDTLCFVRNIYRQTNISSHLKQCNAILVLKKKKKKKSDRTGKINTEILLILEAPITTAAEDIHKYFSLFSRENKT